MEFLVHNISHSDLIVELSWISETHTAGQAATISPSSNASNSSNDHNESQFVTVADGTIVPLAVLGRPKFSLFQQISQKIMEKVEELRAGQVFTPVTDPPSGGITVTEGLESPSKRKAALAPSFLDIVSENRVDEKASSRKKKKKVVRWKAKCEYTQSPIGFSLKECPIGVDDLQDFQIRGGSEVAQLIEKHWSKVAITAVYFPLIALLLPKWLQVLTEFKSETSKQLVYLISGAGIPRNTSHSLHGNSTEITAQLIRLFVQQYYPQMDVIQVHSGSNIFRFDDNVQFMTQKLRPLLEAHRETLVDKCGEAWKAHFHVTIAYTDGPPARLSALNASLRIFRPSYLHIWQLKTYWHERKLSFSDVDFHSFENIEASPCTSLVEADPITQMLVKEMRIFRDQFLKAEGEGEVGNFWLRKSRKPVLAVLLIEKEDAQGDKVLVVYRGMNCEVSMPTGSLCAERNAIGSALASDPTLKRRALKMIGVLGLNLGGSPASSTPEHKTSTNTTNKEEEDGSVASLLLSTTNGSSTASSPQRKFKKRRPEQVNSNYTSPARKPKRPRTFSCDDTSLEALTRIDALDRNPLAPCGACKEWLLKIAEANPSFRVVTFENARCRNFYINQIM